ncbi:MAG: CDP-alcohol phosphatidyltransferase family protein [Trueperaceae bacterium]
MPQPSPSPDLTPSGPETDTPSPRHRRVASVRGYLIHVYTASTLFFVVLAVQWILDGRYALALVAMAVTLLIDASDGTLARKYRVTETAGRIDGVLLDNIVDFASYVFLPLLFLMHADLLAQPMVAFATVVALSSAYGFSRTTAKLSEEGFFVGFPSYWNVVAFYLYVAAWNPWINTAIVVVLSLLAFTDLKFLYVSRLKQTRWLHVILGSVFGVSCMTALFLEPGALRSGLIYLSLGYVAFYAVHSLVADVQSRRRAGA